MSVLPMKRVVICALKKDRKYILELLQRQSVIEINDVVEEDSVFQKTDMSLTRGMFDKHVVSARQALEILLEYAPETKSMLSALEGRKELSVQDYDISAGKQEEVLKVVSKLLALSKQLSENIATIPKIEAQLEALVPWMGLDVPLNFKGTKKTKVFIGTLPNEISSDEICTQFKLQGLEEGNVEVQIISSCAEQTCIFAVCSNKDADQVEDALRKLNFARPPMSDMVPAKMKETLEAERLKLQASNETLRADIIALKDYTDDLKFLIDYFTMRSEKYGVLSNLVQSNYTFILSGFVPEREVERLEAALHAKFDLVAEFTEPKETEDVPVLLHNNGFVSPVESVVESYSLPSKKEFDPSSMVACFYYILFGLMLSDGAYGLIMVLTSGFCLYRFRNMEEGMKKTLKLFLFSGISTAFWGFMFGSFFGDAVNVIATTFFNRPDITLMPIWFEPVKEPMRMLVFAFAVGILHLFTGLGVRFYTCARRGEWKDALYDVVFWYMLVGGGIAYLLTMDMFVDMMGLSFKFPPVVATIAMVSAIVGAIGIILTSGRESRNWGKRILKGLYGLYNVTGYLSDILSYSRLLALGLATGVISTVFNKMGSMLGGGITGIIVFILVFLIGHTLNLGINLLGAYVHTNRLQFVEFFGKFYEGGGRRFAPFTMNTKYFKIKEDI